MDEIPIGDALEGRLQEAGWRELPEIDLLVWFLGGGMSRAEAWKRAAELYARIGGLRSLRGLGLESLLEAGLTRRQGASLLAAQEIGRRSQRRLLPRSRGFGSSREVYLYFRSLTLDLAQEVFWTVLLDGKNRILNLARISEGCLTRALVHPREVFRPAIREAAAGVLFVHNHPSGDPQPSPEDLEITRRLVETGNVVGIRVLDHVIIGRYRYFSFADEGLLPAPRSG